MCIIFRIKVCVTNERVGDEFPRLIRCESCLIVLTLRMFPCYLKLCGQAVIWNNLPPLLYQAIGLFCLMPQFSPVRSISIWVSIYWGHQRTIYPAQVPSPQSPRTLEARQISFRLDWFNHEPRLFDTNKIISTIEHWLLDNLDAVYEVILRNKIDLSDPRNCLYVMTPEGRGWTQLIHYYRHGRTVRVTPGKSSYWPSSHKSSPLIGWYRIWQPDTCTRNRSPRKQWYDDKYTTRYHCVYIYPVHNTIWS